MEEQRRKTGEKRGKTGKNGGKRGKMGGKRGESGGEMGEDRNCDEWVKVLRSLALPLFLICIPLLMLLSSAHRYVQFSSSRRYIVCAHTTFGVTKMGFVVGHLQGPHTS